MAKKNKSASKVVGKTAKKGARKAMKSVKKHKPFTAALVALGGLASSIVASEKFRDGLDELVARLMSRASNALDRVQTKTSDALARVGGDREDQPEAAHA